MSIQKVVTAIKEIDYEKNFKINGTNIDDCVIEWINGSAAISKDDIKAKMQDIETNGTAKEQKKASGKQKLLDLGLTEEEVKALIGV
jgi:hypothetical protein